MQGGVTDGVVGEVITITVVRKDWNVIFSVPTNALPQSKDIKWICGLNK